METAQSHPAQIARFASDYGRAQLIAGAGASVMLISLAAALLPLTGGPPGSTVIGTMMVVAGVVEMAAGNLRRQNRALAMLPGLATVAAGALFAVHPFGKFVPAVWLVISWLAARGVLLGLTGLETRGSVRWWTIVAAVTDLSLSAILLLWLSATTITIALFGPTSEVVGSFAWVLALSVVAAGILLLEVAACEDA